MSVRVRLLAERDEHAYETFLRSTSTTLLFPSLKYRDFLRRVTEGSEPFYLVAYEGERIVGALPSFIRRHATYGHVLNSLPFFGSNGGIIVSPEASDALGVQRALIEALDRLAVEEDVVVATLVANPLAPAVQVIERSEWYTVREERIGQVTRLPAEWIDREDLTGKLMSMLHQKTRNRIRKALERRLALGHSGELETLRTLAGLHRENLEALGGPAKPWSAFEAIREIFTYDSEYRVYLAELNGVPLAGLLVLFYNATAEYFVPAASTEGRREQALSLVILEAMGDAAARGCRSWNWGGTWVSQEGLHRFKKRWGTTDLPYSYYIRAYGDLSRIAALGESRILREYPYFFVFPFSRMRARGVQPAFSGMGEAGGRT